VPNQRPSKFLGESLRSSDAASSSHPHQAIARTRVRSAPTPVPVSFAALSRGRRWLGEMLSGSAKRIEEIANREGQRKVNMTLSLAFLAPEIVKAAIDGRLPRGVGISRLSDLPASWREQFRQLGIAAPVVD
jgi:hypothetical protein